MVRLVYTKLMHISLVHQGRQGGALPQSLMPQSLMPQSLMPQSLMPQSLMPKSLKRQRPGTCTKYSHYREYFFLVRRSAGATLRRNVAPMSPLNTSLQHLVKDIYYVRQYRHFFFEVTVDIFFQSTLSRGTPRAEALGSFCV